VFQFKLDSVFGVGYVPQFFLLAPSSARLFVDLLNEFLVFFKIECNSIFVSMFKGAAFQFIVHLLVFKDTFILRFYSICPWIYIFFFVRDDPDWGIPSGTEDKTSHRSFYVGVHRRNWSCFEGMKCRKIFFDVGFKLTYLCQPNNRRYTLFLALCYCSDRIGF
jgi:hypothetical protein